MPSTDHPARANLFLFFRLSSRPSARRPLAINARVPGSGSAVGGADLEIVDTLTNRGSVSLKSQSHASFTETAEKYTMLEFRPVRSIFSGAEGLGSNAALSNELMVTSALMAATQFVAAFIKFGPNS